MPKEENVHTMFACLPLLAWPFVLLTGSGFSQETTVPSSDLRLDSAQAEAALAIVAGDNEWQRLLSTDGYLRLKRREAEMGRPFGDGEFRLFLSSEKIRESQAEEQQLRI